MSLYKATFRDLPTIMELIHAATRKMQDAGIDQWGWFYPTEGIIRADIEEESLYCIETDSHLIGIVTINEHQDPQWSQVQWLIEKGKPLIVHRLTIHPAFQGQGHGHKTMEWVEGYAKAHGYSSIRLDAYQGNSNALALYENNEFIKTGEVYFPYRSLSFNCYEKVTDNIGSPQHN